jgi:CHAT domain-containing protein/Flp pilus assembly protein TadD
MDARRYAEQIMDWKMEEEDLIRRYLLDDASDEERRQVEARLLEDDDYGEWLLLIEGELIDDYARGAMPAREQELFARNFLLTPRRRQDLIIAQEMTNHGATDSLRLGEAAGQETNMAAETRTTKGSIRQAQAIESGRERNWRQMLFSPGWKIAAYAALALGIGLAAWQWPRDESEAKESMIALIQAYSEYRPIESRISGFNYAQFDQARDASANDSGYAAREHAEVLIRSMERKNHSPAALHLLGRLYLAKKEYDKAVAQLLAAQTGDPNNAQIYNDLGAAMLEKAKAIRADDTSGERLAAAGQSVEYLNKSLELDSSSTEALFNRALCFELLKNSPRAKEDWENYLQKDPSSQWAEEAKRRLARLTQQGHKIAPARESLRGAFEQALQAGDKDAAWRALSLGRSQPANLVVEQMIENFLASSAKGNPTDIYGPLRLLKQAGDLELRMAGDRFTAELAHYYEAASPQRRTASAQARELLKQGHARRTESVAEAVWLYRKAGKIFDRGGDFPEAGLADLHTGKNLIWASRLDEAVAVLQRLSRAADERKFLWLQSQALAQLGNAFFALNNFSKALDCAHQSLKIAERIGDRDSQADCLITIADVHYYLGDHRAALSRLEQSFSLADVASLPLQVSWRNRQVTSLIFASLGLYSTALEYQKDALRLAEILRVPVIKARTYTYLGWLYVKLGKYDEGIGSVKEAVKIGENNQSDPVGRIIIAMSSLRLGHLYRFRGQFDEALACYDRQIALAGRMNLPFDSYWARQGKFLAYAAQKNNGPALEELRAWLKLFEEYRDKIVQETTRNSFFDTSQEAYDAAIRFAYSSLGDPGLAFEYSEISRARSLLDLIAKPTARPLTLAEAQSRLPKDAQIVQYTVLDDTLITWVISPGQTPGKITHVGQPIAASVLTDKVGRYIRLVNSKPGPLEPAPMREAEELYDILIKPVRRLLKYDKQICIIPDKTLCYLPFGALLSAESKQYLLEEFTLSVAPSASAFLTCADSAQAKRGARGESLFSVGDPYFDRTRFPKLNPLDSAEREAREIARYYPGARVMTGAEATESSVKRAMAKAEVIHIAAHGLADEQSSLNSALMLAPDRTGERSADTPETDGVLHAYEIYGSALPRARLVVLSACQSGVETFHRGEGMIGLARPFLAAGAPLVVSSLWKVDSEATSDLMIRFHKHRKQTGLPTAQALRRAQRELLHDEGLGYRHPYYWAAFSVVGGGANA